MYEDPNEGQVRPGAYFVNSLPGETTCPATLSEGEKCPAGSAACRNVAVLEVRGGLGDDCISMCLGLIIRVT